MNDYSRFEQLDDPDEEDPLAESLRSKDRGNDAFKRKEFAEAVSHYTEAISDLPPKRDDKKNEAARQLRVGSSERVGRWIGWEWWSGADCLIMLLLALFCFAPTA